MRYIIKETPCGTLRGADTQKGYSWFLNIPYAKANRWERPVETTRWEGIYDATTPTPWCPQRASFGMDIGPTARFYAYESVVKQEVPYSEDCQRLNIWMPEKAEKAPVLVYIHGGGNQTGGSTAPNFNGSAYAKRGLVTVTINYRLNIFGSAVDGESFTGNYGLWDQITALRWIRNNIAAFGGDPDCVTVMGESAGAVAVQNLIYAPQAKGLFHRAIMMSGGGLYHRNRYQDSYIKLWQDVCRELGVSGLRQLQDHPAAELFSVWSRLCKVGKYGNAASPMIDGITIPEEPGELAKTGKVNSVPAIIGILSEDMWPHRLYEAATQWSQWMTQHSLAPTYGYYFDRQLPGSDDGAYHACDIRYAFDTLDQCWRPFTEVDRRISRDMMDYFEAFARSGQLKPAHLPAWEPISKAQQFMHFGDEPCAMVDVPQQRLMDWQAKGKPFPLR